MKNRTQYLMLTLFVAIISMAFVACSGSKQGKDKKGKEYTSAYICPMHCEGSGSATMGKCPKCGMDYKANPDAKSSNGHNHDGHNHDGHDHGDHNHDGHDHSGHDHSGHNH